MTAAETIQAAIDKLEGHRRAATEGRWQHKRSLDNHWVESNDRIALAEAISQPDAELIVTLHRTIDAQLAILRWYAATLATAPGFEPHGSNEFIALARAILGEEVPA